MTMAISASLSAAASGAPGIGGMLSNGTSSFPYGLAMRFKVVVDDCDLGGWSACRGLKVELKVTRVQEGGSYWYERLIPDQIMYSNITLQRAVHPKDSVKVLEWLRTVATKWENYSDQAYAGKGTGTIILLGASGQTVMSWPLTGVYPVSWSGPELSATDNKVAIETLELAHQGFLHVSQTVPGP